MVGYLLVRIKILEITLRIFSTFLAYVTNLRPNKVAYPNASNVCQCVIQGYIPPSPANKRNSHWYGLEKALKSYEFWINYMLFHAHSALLLKLTNIRCILQIILQN